MTDVNLNPEVLAFTWGLPVNLGAQHALGVGLNIRL
jgi:hypothetical protein